MRAVPVAVIALGVVVAILGAVMPAWNFPSQWALILVGVGTGGMVIGAIACFCQKEKTGE